MQLYGIHEDFPDHDNVPELKGITIYTNLNDLKILSQFLVNSINLMEKHGEDFGHEHLNHFMKEKEWSNPDFIIVGKEGK